MSGPGKITVNPRTGDSRREGEIPPQAPQNRTNRRRLQWRRHQNSGGQHDSAETGRVPEGRQEEDEDGERIIQEHVDDHKQDQFLGYQEYDRTQFYEHYHTLAEEYDDEFHGKHDDDLTTTLIFAGLFSTVTSAFIIAVDSQLRPDPGDETAALLRVLIYKIDNTTFGNDVPPLPMWGGPPPTLVHVQAILFASLFVSLFSAFLAMLGKQWLNRYEATDMRGTAIDRSQNRQQKLDGIDAWYFHIVMESMPLMLQAALLLLGCALSLYLWDMDTAISSVVVGISSFGVIFYFAIIIAGVVTESCPYQTPISQFICYLAPNLRSTLRRAFTKLRDLVPKVPPAVADGARRRWRATQAMIALLARLFRVHTCDQVTPHTTEPQSTSQTAPLDLRCILWTLRTCLDKAIRISALEYLTSVLKRAKFSPCLVVECFNILVSSISVNDEGVESTPKGVEQLEMASARCFYRAFLRLTVMDPTSRDLETIRQHYLMDFSHRIDFTGLPSRHTIAMIHALITSHWTPRSIWHGDDRPSDRDHILFARDIAELAQAEYQRQQKVPEWILGFTFHSLSLDPLPQVSTVANCLQVIAIDLGCEVPEVAAPEESVQMEVFSTLIAQKLDSMGYGGDRALVMNRFNVFVICIRISDRRMAITQGLEQLAAASAGCVYRTFHRLAVMDPTLSGLEDIRQLYRSVVPDWVDFMGVPSHNTRIMIHALINEDWSHCPTWHDEDRPSDPEHIQFALDIAELAQAEYQRQQKVPDWILGFAFDSLSLDPLPQASIVADCLKVIAIGLGCDVSDYAIYEESVQVGFLATLIAQELETMVEDGDQALVIHCFNIFAICIRDHNGRIVVAQGLERLAMASAGCIYRIFCRLAVSDPTSRGLEDIRQLYRSIVPDGNDFTGVPSGHTMTVINALTRRNWSPHPVWRDEDRPSDHEHIQFARDIAELAQAEYRWGKKVPQWILSFAFDSLSLDPLPPASVVADCLKMSAIDLGCDVPDIATSDESVQVEVLSTLIARKLETMVEGGGRALTTNRFKIFAICIRNCDGRVVITKGLERLAIASAGGVYRAFYHLTITDPTSSVLEDMHRRYHEIFPDRVDFTGLTSHNTMIVIRALIEGEWSARPIWRGEDRPTDPEHIRFALDIAELARAEYRRQQKVPEWILSFAFDSLSLDPLPQASIVADCLKVIAIDLGCDISNVAAPDKSAQAEVVSNLITRKLETMVRLDQTPAISKREAICTLIPYAIFLEQHGQQEVANAIMNVVRASEDYYFMSSIPSYITTLLAKPPSPFRNWLVALVAPCVDWEDEAHGEDTVVGWAVAASTVPDADEVVRSVVGTLMRITNNNSLRLHLPIEIWAWIKKWQSLPLVDWGRFYRTTPDAVCHVRGLGDSEIIKLYLLALLVWYFPSAKVLNEVETSIREDFGGIGMWGHREDLLKWLACILKEMIAEGDNLDHYNKRLRRCKKLKGVLLHVDKESTKTLVESHSTFACALPLQCL